MATTPPTLLSRASFDLGSSKAFDNGTIGSPLKRARASVSGLDEEAMRQRLGLGLSGVLSGDPSAGREQEEVVKKEAEEDEEL